MQKKKTKPIAWVRAGLSLLWVGQPMIAVAQWSAIATISMTANADAATLTRWQFDPTSRELQFTVPGGTTPQHFLLAQPARIVVDLPNTELGSVTEQQSYSGDIRSIRVSQFQPNVARIVIELSPNTVLAPQQVELTQVGETASGTQWVLRPILADEAATVATQPSSPSATAPASPPTVEEALPQVEPAPTVPPTNATVDAEAEAPEEPPAVELPPLEPGAIAIPSRAPEDSPQANDIATEQAPEAVSDTDESAVLPPLETGAVELPVALEAPPEQEHNAAEEPATSDEPDEPDEPAASGEPAASDETEADRQAANEPAAVEPAIAPADDATPEPEATASSTPDEVVASTPPTSDDVGDLPPATFLGDQPVTVSVPPLNRTDDASRSSVVMNETETPTASAITLPETTATALNTAPTQADLPTPGEEALDALPPPTPENLDEAIEQPQPEATTLPQVDAAASTLDEPSPSLDNPALTTPQATPASPEPASPAISQPPRIAAASIIDFGQPLPSNLETASAETGSVQPANSLPDDGSTQVAVASSSSVLIPADTRLNLRYPGNTAIQLQAETPRQEVLVLNQSVIGSNGELILAEGTPIIGRFETDRSGSRFIGQAIALQTGNVPFKTVSDPLSGDRELSGNNLLRNSAIGGAALTVLTGFTGIGLLAGLAAGAATTYLTSPQPAVIQPSQVIEVRVVEDLLR